MKKSIYLGLVGLAALGMTSCDDNSTNSQTYPIMTVNLVTSNEVGVAPEVVGSYYTFAFDITNGNVQISTDFTLDKSRVAFTTPSLPYKTAYAKDENVMHEAVFVNALMGGSSSSGASITDIDCELTTMAYIPPTISGLPSVSTPAYKYTIMSYNYGVNQKVRTFWPDVTFRGKTQTSYSVAGQPASYQTEDILYRVIMTGKNNDKATVILYNAKFTDVAAEPTKSNVVLEDLALEFTNMGYTIKGTNVVPKVYESGTGVANPSFTFDEFNLTSTGNMVGCDIDYKVAGKYEGTFSGVYAKLLKSEVEK